MAMNDVYASIEPARTQIDVLEGPTMIEFGSPWCGYCRAAQPLLAAAFANHPRRASYQNCRRQGQFVGAFFQSEALAHLVFLNNGRETARLVRPGDASPIRKALAQIDAIDHD